MVTARAHSLLQLGQGETEPPAVGEREEPAPPTYYAIPLVLLAMGGVFWWLRSRRPGPIKLD